VSDFGKNMIYLIGFLLLLALIAYPFSVAAAKLFLLILEVVLVGGILIVIGKMIKAYVTDEGVWAVMKLEAALAGLMLLAILIWFALRAE